MFRKVFNEFDDMKIHLPWQMHCMVSEPFSWPFLGLDVNNTRNNTEETILSVKSLGPFVSSSFNNIGPDGHIDMTVGANDEVEWIGGVGLSVPTPPVVDDGVVYFADLAGISYAYTVDGTLLWLNQLPFSVGLSFPVISLLTEDQVFYTIFGNYSIPGSSDLLIATDKNTGQTTGTWDATEYHPLVSLASATMTVNTSFDGGNSSEEIIVFGLTSWENAITATESELGPQGFTFPGGLIAFKTSDFGLDLTDPDNPQPSEVHIGDAAWVFKTTDNHYNIPLTADQEISAGSTIWSLPVADITRGVLYVGTGQNYDNFTGLDEVGKEPVDNPLSDAVIAVNHTTGDLV